MSNKESLKRSKSFFSLKPLEFESDQIKALENLHHGITPYFPVKEMEENPNNAFYSSYEKSPDGKPYSGPDVFISAKDDNGYRMFKVQFKGKFIKYSNDPDNLQASTNYYKLDRDYFLNWCKLLGNRLNTAQEDGKLVWEMLEDPQYIKEVIYE